MATKTIKPTLPRLKALYNDEYAAQLQKDLGLSNANQTPRLEKIVVSVGMGKLKDDKRMFEVATNTLAKITGQKPINTYARMSIASFKLREGNKIGMKVTLRDARMYEFLDRLVNIVLPKLRDFHGVSNKSFDAQGNYNIGLSEQSLFPELTFEESSQTHGLQITIVTTTKNADHAKALLAKFGMPFQKENK